MNSQASRLIDLLGVEEFYVVWHHDNRCGCSSTLHSGLASRSNKPTSLARWMKEFSSVKTPTESLLFENGVSIVNHTSSAWPQKLTRWWRSQDIRRRRACVLRERDYSQASRRTARSEHRSARRRQDSGAKGPPIHPVPPTSLEER